MLLLQNQRGVPLPVAPNRQALEAEAGERGKRVFIQMLKAQPPRKTRGETQPFSARPEQKATPRAPAPIQSTIFWEPQVPLSKSPGQLSSLQVTVPFQVSSWNPQAPASSRPLPGPQGPANSPGSTFVRERKALPSLGLYYFQVWEGLTGRLTPQILSLIHI